MAAYVPLHIPRIPGHSVRKGRRTAGAAPQVLASPRSACSAAVVVPRRVGEAAGAAGAAAGGGSVAVQSSTAARSQACPQAPPPGMSRSAAAPVGTVAPI